MNKPTLLQRLINFFLRSVAGRKTVSKDTPSARKRFQTNLSLEPKLIESQYKGCFIADQSKLGTLVYGRSDMAYAGCELIAIYNFARHMGINISLSKLIYLSETTGAILRNGKWGTNPYRIPELLHQIGIDKTTPSKENNKAFIISFWNSRHIKNGIHTVFFSVIGDELLAYNLHSSSEPQRIRIESHSKEDIESALTEHIRGGIVTTWP